MIDALPTDALLCVVGPTASGKSDLAMKLAEQLGGEIVGADSVQIYRGFDIGSGKPSAADRAQVPHHMIDVVDPLDDFDAGRFVTLADQAIAEIQGRGQVPIVCGGTFLWVKALWRGLAPSAPKDDAIRARHQAQVERHGRESLHRQLAERDPQSAVRLNPNDFVRVSRALEVLQLTGKPQSAWHAEHAFSEERHRVQLLGVERARDTLDERITRRASAWLDGGWIEEVQGLLEQGFDGARAMSAVGYRQVREHLDGAISRDELLTSVVRATRTFVRRQRTWLRDQPVRWVSPN
jgi:tRNA dimethylallyltransferase